MKRVLQPPKNNNLNRVDNLCKYSNYWPHKKAAVLLYTTAFYLNLKNLFLSYADTTLDFSTPYPIRVMDFSISSIDTFS